MPAAVVRGRLAQWRRTIFVQFCSACRRTGQSLRANTSESTQVGGFIIGALLVCRMAAGSTSVAYAVSHWH